MMATIPRRALLLLVVSCGLAHAGDLPPLYQAVADDAPDAIAAALTAGAKIDAVEGPGGQTALMYAVLNGKANAVTALLEKGADVTIAEKDGYTPMHGAAFQGHAPVVRALAAAGVPVDEPHTDGYRPVDRACWGTEKRHAKTVGVLVQLGAKMASQDDCKTENPFTGKVLDHQGIPRGTKKAFPKPPKKPKTDL